MSGNQWLLGRDQPQARLRLYCFSHAGGNAAACLPWQEQLGPGIALRAVQLPTRGMRLHEPPYLAMAPLLRDLADVIAADLDGRPFAFFGHSLGALLAFELARTLYAEGRGQAERLILSGSAAPWLRAPPRRLHLLPDPELVAALREMGGTPAAILAEPELMAMLLPAIRADFALVDSYRHQPGQPLPIPLTILAGRSDERTDSAGIAAWSDATSQGCAVHWFDGGHFFLHQQQDAVLACLRRCLS